MKKTRILLFFLGLLYFLLIFPSFSASHQPLILKVGVYENPPKIFIDDKGNASGFWPEIIKYIAQQEGWQIEWDWCIWSQCLENLENNKIDLMPDVGFTELRSKKYAFSQETILVSWSRIYTQQNSGIKTILDLEGKK